ncbi:nucleotide-binding universal stress UspA family protein [Catalinimonas alkaloidigena]|uniref:universal stress protein n=1 Tax=Catalinimonas alkaloidigena TaxID=1075417 RepID=UPI00240514F2|nr:universal stress protein [Catalinimonas alkaloidigena]MDF9796544.1 nucleotide-binding universal stress UspA family protein [Catalinimonas alkaloidigena]
MRTILVPTDFSPQAANALDAACQLSGKLGATIHLVYVLEFPMTDEETVVTHVAVLPVEYLRKIKRESEEHLREVAAAKQQDGLTITYEVRVGNPYRSINNALLAKEADLVVMGSKGASGSKEILLGSNAERMVRFAHCPVLVIKDKVDLSKIKNIVYATALLDEESVVTKALSKLQTAFEAQLHVVRINTISNFLDDPYVMDMLQKFAKDHHLKDYTLNTFSDIGEEEGIIHFAKQKGAELIALATHGRRGILHLLEGSLAEDIVNHAKFPILTMSLRKHKTRKK